MNYLKKSAFILFVIGSAILLFIAGHYQGSQIDCNHPEIETWELNWINDNLVRARDSHQKAYDSGNAYWMPLQKQMDWVIFYDRMLEIMVEVTH